MTSPAETNTFDAVACPFCGIHCDDTSGEVTGTSIKLTNTNCARARAGFERSLPEHFSPQIKGEDVSLEDAVAHASKIIKSSKSPLYAGLGTDVSGMRNILELADKTCGTVDHMGSDSLMRNIMALSDRGWIMTSLTELRNRADLIIFAGTDATEHSRFYERVIWPEEALFVEKDERELVYLGKGLKSKLGTSPSGKAPQSIPCEIEQLPALMNALSSLYDGVDLQSKKLAGVSKTQLVKLVEKIKAAKYSVIIWSPSKFDFNNAELAISATSDLIRKVTKTQRMAGLSLGGSEGLASVYAVSTWQAGYPLRISFAEGYPDYNPRRHSTSEMLKSETADALIWVSSIGANHLPPETDLPTIVLGEPGMALETTPDVFIPVGTPGIDHTGIMVRVDSVVSLPMKKLRDAGLPSTRDVIGQILQAL